MVLCTMQALGELAVMYPVNGAFFHYGVRFIDPAWGFAMGWQYALGAATVLPFEITAAGITISYWHEYNIGIWIAVFLSLLVLIQFWGVRGYAEIEFLLSLFNILGIVGFVIFGIVDDCGGVATDGRGYIGFRYWNDSANGNTAFRNGFKGFCSVFVNAAFAFGGTELVGLTAAEAINPLQSLPKATKQVAWRITGFYIISLLIIGLIVPNNSPDLLNSLGANTKASPYVLALQYAGLKGLPSVFNAIIAISVISVANSVLYGATRVIQALSQSDMGPRWLAKVDSRGRPVGAIIVVLCIGLLAFINEANVGAIALDWLMAISGLSSFFAWGSICLCHVRFRQAWKAAGRSLDDLPFRAQTGVAGSYLALLLLVLCLIATFYVALFPIGGSPSAEGFFSTYLAAPVVITFFVFWKIWTRDWSFLIKIEDIDLDSGRRYENISATDGVDSTDLEETVGITRRVMKANA